VVRLELADDFGWPITSLRQVFHGQAAMVVCTVTIVLATAQLFPDLQARLVLAGCYGAALAWVTAWCKSSRRMSL
jgi:hypothetical protein